MTKRIFLATALLIAVLTISVAHAQGNTIEFGQVVTATMTNSEYEFEYTFSGKGGDIVIAEMRAVDPFGEMNSPLLILLDANNDIVADTTNAFSFTNALLAAELPADGTYSLLATREDGRTGDSVGDFTLELITPTEVTAEAPATGSASSEGRNQYFLVRADSSFSASYRRISGELAAQMSINTLDPDTGGLKEIAVVSGEKLTLGTVGEFEPGAYIIAVGEAPFAFSFEEVTADFEVSVAAAE